MDWKNGGFGWTGAGLVRASRAALCSPALLLHADPAPLDCAVHSPFDENREVDFFDAYFGSKNSFRSDNIKRPFNMVTHDISIFQGPLIFRYFE